MAQLRLEQMALALRHMEQSLLLTAPILPDREAVLDRVQRAACDTCPERRGCKGRLENLEERLLEHGYRAGLVSEERREAFLARRHAIEAEKERLEHTTIRPTAAVNELLTNAGSTPLSTGASAADLLRRPQVDYALLAPVDENRPALCRRDAETMENEIKYAGYIKKQEDAARKLKKMDDMPLPADLDYKAIPGLRLEAAQKLDAIRPLSLGQAERISGVNPADVTVLVIWLQQRRG